MIKHTHIDKYPSTSNNIEFTNDRSILINREGFGFCFLRTSQNKPAISPIIAQTENPSRHCTQHRTGLETPVRLEKIVHLYMHPLNQHYMIWSNETCTTESQDLTGFTLPELALLFSLRERKKVNSIDSCPKHNIGLLDKGFT